MFESISCTQRRMRMNFMFRGSYWRDGQNWNYNNILMKKTSTKLLTKVWGNEKLFSLMNRQGQAQWLMPVILVTLEAEIRRLAQGHPGQKVSETEQLKITCSIIIQFIIWCLIVWAIYMFCIFFIFIFIVILLLYMGDIVTFTNVLAIYLSEINHFHHPPSSSSPHS
jgi:hypothetical protein